MRSDPVTCTMLKLLALLAFSSGAVIGFNDGITHQDPFTQKLFLACVFGNFFALTSVCAALLLEQFLRFIFYAIDQLLGA
jgi:putative Mn2+ efflux pump MntP